MGMSSGADLMLLRNVYYCIRDANHPCLHDLLFVARSVYAQRRNQRLDKIANWGNWVDLVSATGSIDQVFPQVVSSHK